MGVAREYFGNQAKLIEYLKSLVWVGISQVTLDKAAKKDLFYSVLIFEPSFWEKLEKDPSFEPQELQNLINSLSAKFTFSLAAYLRPAASGDPLQLRSLIGLSNVLDRFVEIAMEDAEAYESHRKSEKGEQDLPFFLR
ncbi:MAG: hypothetical protein WEC39_01855 [Patescibacteria group bacterium]